MTLDRKDYKSAIPQLEKRLEQIEKLGKDVFNKFDDIAHQTQLDAAEVEKKVLALDYQMDTLQVVMEYALLPNGQTPTPSTTWSTTMPTLDKSTQGKTLWFRSVTYRNDIVVQRTEPQTVNIMDGVYSFVNTVAGNAGWTTINGSYITTGVISSSDGKCYFDLMNNNFQLKDGATLATSDNALVWNGSSGTLYVKGDMELAKDGLSYLKAYLNGTTPTLRVGTETGPHFSLSADKFKFYFTSESLDPSPIGISQTSSGPIFYDIDQDGEGSVIRRDGVYWEGLSHDRVNCLNWRGLTLSAPTNWERGIYDETLDEWILYAEGTGEGGDQNYVRIPRVYKKTTTSAANVYVATGSDTQGRLFRSTASSKRYKTDIEDIENADALYDIPVRQFKYRDDYLTDKDDIRFGKTVPGFIAEDVEKVYPIAVEYADGKVEDWAARYIIPPMLKLIQEQKKQIDELAERVGKLEKPNV